MDIERSLRKVFTVRILYNVIWTVYGVQQVVTMFIEGMNEVDSRTCAVYSDLTNTLTSHSCDSKYEWICKVPRGVCVDINVINVNMSTFVDIPCYMVSSGVQLIKPYWYSDRKLRPNIIDID